jgi:hypothetical protein
MILQPAVFTPIQLPPQDVTECVTCGSRIAASPSAYRVEFPNEPEEVTHVCGLDCSARLIESLDLDPQVAR